MLLTVMRAYKEAVPPPLALFFLRKKLTLKEFLVLILITLSPQSGWAVRRDAALMPVNRITKPGQNFKTV